MAAKVMAEFQLTPAEASQLLNELGEAKRGAGAVRIEALCSLWGGMGTVYLLDGHVILKRVRYPTSRSLSDARKVDSYKVEAAFYEGHAARLRAPPVALALPEPLRVRATSDGLDICMRRLDGQEARGALSAEQSEAAIEWLARLHAAYWGVGADELGGLHAQGTYWYLDTRPDELQAIPTHGWQGRLRLAARALDERLKADRFQTAVHGDAKAANMLFAKGADGRAVAQLYDFQYAGRAPPTKDLAYFLGCAAGAAEGEREDALLRRYHAALAAALRERGRPVPRLAALRESLVVAYADLYRFLAGWGDWGSAGLSRRARALVDELDGGEPLTSEAAYRDALFARMPPEYGGLLYDE